MSIYQVITQNGEERVVDFFNGRSVLPEEELMVLANRKVEERNKPEKPIETNYCPSWHGAWCQNRPSLN